MLTINIGVPFLVAIIGAVLFLLCNAPNTRSQDFKKLALCAWWCGLLVTLFVFATSVTAHIR